MSEARTLPSVDKHSSVHLCGVHAGCGSWHGVGEAVLLTVIDVQMAGEALSAGGVVGAGCSAGGAICP